MSGARMSIALYGDALSHEMTDSGGIMYFKDGTRTSWRYANKRMSCPDWVAWHLVDWSKME